MSKAYQVAGQRELDSKAIKGIPGSLLFILYINRTYLSIYLINFYISYFLIQLV